MQAKRVICASFVTLVTVQSSFASYSSSVITIGGQPVQTSGTRKLNDNGVALFQTPDPLSGAHTIGIWSSATSGELVGGTEGTESIPGGINNSGTIVGWGHADSGNFAETGAPAAGYIISPQHAVSYFPWFQGSSPLTQFSAINDDGAIIATVNSSSLTIFNHGASSSFSFPSNVIAASINSGGSFAGFYNNPSPQPTELRSAMLYFDGSEMHTFKELGGFQDVRGLDINDVGLVVGTASRTSYQNINFPSDGPQSTAFIYSDATFHQLRPLDGLANSQAMAVNNYGVVVGLSRSEYFDPIPTMWVDGYPSSITDQTVDLPAGVDLLYAVDINDSGQILAVANRDGFGEYLVVLTPNSIPEPACTALLGAVGTMTLLNRKRRQVFEGS